MRPAPSPARGAMMAKPDIRADALALPPLDTQGSTAPTAESLLRDGVRFWGMGDRPGAVARIDASLAQESGNPAALSMAAFMLAEMGKPEAAMAFYRRALDNDPSHRVAWSNLGKLLFALRRYQEARHCFQAACRLDENDADAWCSLSGALRELGRLVEAVEAGRRALEARPVFAEAALNLGNAFLKLDRMDEALDAYRRALGANPQFAAAHCGEALALKSLGRFAEARRAFVRAEELGSVEATSGKGCLDLSQGDFEKGWRGYEARWLAGRSIAEALGIRFPRWRGPGDCVGETVLVLNDHGLGDTIQFVRYLPLMEQAGVKPLFACPKKLRRLVAASMPIAFAEPDDPNLQASAQIALSSLPYAFGTRLETIPADTPYLRAEPDRLRHWAQRIGEHGFKVGLNWRGNLNPEADPARSAPLAAFAPLAAIEGVRLISLQAGPRDARLDAAAPTMRVERLGDAFDAGEDSFIDTAAAMMALDLVVTCDTSAAHLAGALNRPVWVALKRDAEWRWLIERDDSPWYPGMRLFRQETRGDWAGVGERMARELGRVGSVQTLETA